MGDHMQSVVAFLAFFGMCALAIKVVAMTEKKKPCKRGIKVGDCITPKHNWGAYDHEFTDINSLASKVHKESRR